MWNIARDWLFPISCIGCGTADVALCARCSVNCLLPVSLVVSGVVVTAAGDYGGVLQQAILALKRGERSYLNPLACLLVRLIASDDVLVPLPTTRRRCAARGFDQAVELARRAAARAGIAACDALEKRGGAQHGRNRRARCVAARRFHVRPGVRLPERAVIVDDVCTTGASLEDGIGALRAAGVTVTGALVLARTAAQRNPGHAGVVMPHGYMLT